MTFKKLASVLLPSVINLMFGGKSLRPLNIHRVMLLYFNILCLKYVNDF